MVKRHPYVAKTGMSDEDGLPVEAGGVIFLGAEAARKFIERDLLAPFVPDDEEEPVQAVSPAVAPVPSVDPKTVMAPSAAKPGK